jgi:hypothetical protein
MFPRTHSLRLVSTQTLHASLPKCLALAIPLVLLPLLNNTSPSLATPNTRLSLPCLEASPRLLLHLPSRHNNRQVLLPT